VENHFFLYDRNVVWSYTGRVKDSHGLIVILLHDVESEMICEVVAVENVILIFEYDRHLRITRRI